MDCPPGNVCFKQDLFLIGSIIAIAILLFLYIKNSNTLTQNLELIENKKYLQQSVLELKKTLERINQVNIDDKSRAEGDLGKQEVKHMKKEKKKLIKDINKKEKILTKLKQTEQIMDEVDQSQYNAVKKEVTKDIVRKEKEREIYFRRLGDPMEEPRRTYPFTKDIYDNVQNYQIKTATNIPTRGVSTDFQPIGILTNMDMKSTPTILQLYGRAIYPGSYRWQYYTNSDNFQSVKVQVIHKGRECMNDTGCEELYTGDLVRVPAYDKQFKVELYRLDRPAYIPQL
jgi:hypothetical protein